MRVFALAFDFLGIKMWPSWVAKVGEINTFIRSAERGVAVRWGTDRAYLLHIDTAKIHKSHAFI